MLILVFTPTIAHLQVPDWGEWKALFENAKQRTTQDFICEITVMFPKRLDDIRSSLEAVGDDTDDACPVGNHICHLFGFIVCIRDLRFPLVHAIQYHAEMLVSLALEGCVCK